VTSYVFRDGKLDEEALRKMVKTVGSGRLVLDLSCRFRDGAYTRGEHIHFDGVGRELDE